MQGNTKQSMIIIKIYNYDSSDYIVLICDFFKNKLPLHTKGKYDAGSCGIFY